MDKKSLKCYIMGYIVSHELSRIIMTLTKIKSFKTLDRIAAAKLDELRMVLADVQLQEDRLWVELGNLDAWEQSERILVSKEPQLAQTFIAFTQSNLIKRTEFEVELKNLQEKKEELLSQIRENYQDQKKWQTMLEQEYAILKAFDKKQEQQELDQLAESRHRQGKQERNS